MNTRLRIWEVEESIDSKTVPSIKKTKIWENFCKGNSKFEFLKSLKSYGGRLTPTDATFISRYHVIDFETEEQLLLFVLKYS